MQERCSESSGQFISSARTRVSAAIFTKSPSSSLLDKLKYRFASTASPCLAPRRTAGTRTFGITGCRRSSIQSSASSLSVGPMSIGMCSHNKRVETKRRAALALSAGLESKSASCAPTSLSAAVAHHLRCPGYFTPLRLTRAPGGGEMCIATVSERCSSSVGAACPGIIPSLRD
jgi:hypothetical protein